VLVTKDDKKANETQI